MDGTENIAVDIFETSVVALAAHVDKLGLRMQFWN
jgi:hypothetical protein